MNERELDVAEIDALREEIARKTPDTSAARWNADPEEVRKAVARLVLTLVELLRQLLERQAIRRMEGGTLDDEQTENIGVALMRLEETIEELARRFELEIDDLNLDLGPLGRLI